MTTPSAPRMPEATVDLVNSIAALIALGGEIVADPSMAREVHEFAAGVLPILQSLDYAPERTIQAGSGGRLAEAAAVADLRAEEEPEAFNRPPIWAN